MAEFTPDPSDDYDKHLLLRHSDHVAGNEVGLLFSDRKFPEPTIFITLNGFKSDGFAYLTRDEARALARELFEWADKTDR